MLIYDYEIIMRGQSLPRPVNYGLVRVLPLKGSKFDPTKRPVVVIDPRAGQGPGIGGFKPVSQVGQAFEAGHPVYFIGFAADPVEGQTIEDIAHAHIVFLEQVIELHPKANGKPFLINPMRYAGGLLGGAWMARMMSDLGGGIFDGAWLISNFDNLNPANMLWTKQYDVWANPEKQQDRYLHFEKWWGAFFKLRGEELQYMVDNLFVGNKLSTAQIVTKAGIRLDIRNKNSPILCFCSHADNITPPQPPPPVRH